MTIQNTSIHYTYTSLLYRPTTSVACIIYIQMPLNLLRLSVKGRKGYHCLCSAHKNFEGKHTPPITTQKRGYPSVLKSAGIAPKSVGIGSKFLSRRFFPRRFRPPLFECGDRVVRTCTSAVQKREDRSRRF